MKRESGRIWDILAWKVSGTIMKNYDSRSKIFVKRGEEKYLCMIGRRKRIEQKETVDHGIH